MLPRLKSRTRHPGKLSTAAAQASKLISSALLTLLHSLHWLQIQASRDVQALVHDIPIKLGPHCLLLADLARKERPHTFSTREFTSREEEHAARSHASAHPRVRGAIHTTGLAVHGREASTGRATHEVWALLYQVLQGLEDRLVILLARGLAWAREGVIRAPEPLHDVLLNGATWFTAAAACNLSDPRIDVWAAATSTTTRAQGNLALRHLTRGWRQGR